jgi:hypothetical protein
MCFKDGLDLCTDSLDGANLYQCILGPLEGANFNHWIPGPIGGTKLKTPWSESACELYRPSDRRLSAK